MFKGSWRWGGLQSVLLAAGADMRVVGQLVLVLLGLLLSAHSELRARDPEVKEEEEQGGRVGGGGGGGGVLPPYKTPHHGETEAPPVAEGGNHVARTGNWCAFVHKRVVTMAVKCVTEKYTIKTQSPCSSGIHNCQLVMYKLSTRPVYTQKHQVLTALQWRRCPGHRGHRCDDTVSDPGSSALTAGQPEPMRTELHDAGVQEKLQQQRGGVSHEQNDYQAAATGPADWSRATAALPVPHMMALVMSQLQPVLEGFNHSLELLSRQVGDLARDVAQLKSSRYGADLQDKTETLDALEQDEAEEEHLEARLDEVSEHIREVRAQMETHRTDMENRLHSQHAMLHYNLTSFKTDIDMKLKRHQKMLQVSLQAVNNTLSELKSDQDQTRGAELEEDLAPPTLLQPSDSSTHTLWEAISRLDDMVVNNTVKLGGLMEDVEVNSGNVQRLTRDMKQLEKLINQTSRKTQILFMETGLEVEAAKVAVMKRMDEIEGNLTQQSTLLKEVDSDVDYVFMVLYQNRSSRRCDCKQLTAAVARLEWSVANVTALVSENRLDLYEDSEGGAGQWGGARDWEPAVEALQHGLQQVRESLVLEETRTKILDHSLAQLNSLVTVGQAEVAVLEDSNKKLKEEMQNHSGSFNSLLNDVSRHNDVLDQLLGHEVLEFLEWPLHEQEANSIPALKERLRNLQEQLRGHSLSITSLGSGAGGRDEVPSADQPSSSHHLPADGLRGDMSRIPAREHQLLLQPDSRHLEHVGDGSDLWNLEKMVEELGLKVHRLEEKPCSCSGTSTDKEPQSDGVDAKLQAEVMWLKRGLEEHLRVFKNVFSNADVLAGSDATLELDKLWQLVKNRDGKKEKKRKGGGEREETRRGGNHRDRRSSPGVAPLPSGLSEDSLLFVAGSPLNISNGILSFRASLNHGQFHSDSGTFTAPVDGIYMFILTLDLRPGPAHVVLQKASGRLIMSLNHQEVAPAGPSTGVSLLPMREGEELRLELREGTWVESQENVFSGLLLHQTT